MPPPYTTPEGPPAPGELGPDQHVPLNYGEPPERDLHGEPSQRDQHGCGTSNALAKGPAPGSPQQVQRDGKLEQGCEKLEQGCRTPESPKVLKSRMDVQSPLPMRKHSSVVEAPRWNLPLEEYNEAEEKLGELEEKVADPPEQKSYGCLDEVLCTESESKREEVLVQDDEEDLEDGPSELQEDGPSLLLTVAALTPFEESEHTKENQDSISVIRKREQPQSPQIQEAPLISTEGTISAWSVRDVKKWTSNLGDAYNSHAEEFERNGVDGQLLASLTDDDLWDLGVKMPVHRRKIRFALKKAMYV